eukprot:2428010-Rhodomonas_salina.1
MPRTVTSTRTLPALSLDTHDSLDTHTHTLPPSKNTLSPTPYLPHPTSHTLCPHSYPRYLLGHVAVRLIKRSGRSRIGRRHGLSHDRGPVDAVGEGRHRDRAVGAPLGAHRDVAPLRVHDGPCDGDTPRGGVSNRRSAVNRPSDPATTAVRSSTTAVLSSTTAILSSTTAVLSSTTAVLSSTTATLSSTHSGQARLKLGGTHPWTCPLSLPSRGNPGSTHARSVPDERMQYW